MSEDPFKDYVDKLLSPLLKRLATLEMVVTILSNKLDDQDCRNALKKFCDLDGKSNGHATPEMITESPRMNGFQEIPGHPALQPIKKRKDQIIDYLSSLDPEKFSQGRTPSNIAQNIKGNYSTVYACLLYHKEDFEKKDDGKWYLRTAPIGITA